MRMVAPTVDPQTRNALVYVDLPVSSDLRAGMFARGEFALGASDALTVPQEALVVRDILMWWGPKHAHRTAELPLEL